MRLHLDDAPAEIWLKLENLQPIGSFKLRGAANAILSAGPDAVARGVVTTSTGNMAQGVAWMARELGIPATIVVPDNASAAKLAAVERRIGDSVEHDAAMVGRVALQNEFSAHVRLSLGNAAQRSVGPRAGNRYPPVGRGRFARISPCGRSPPSGSARQNLCRMPMRASSCRSFADAPGPLIAATAAYPVESVPDAR